MRRIVLILAVLFLSGCGDDDKSSPGSLDLKQAFIGTLEVKQDGSANEGFPTDRSISLIFTAALNQTSAQQAIKLTKDGQPVPATMTFTSSGTSVSIVPSSLLENGKTYSITISDQLEGVNGESFSSKEILFKTSLAALNIVSVKFGDEPATAARVVNVPVDLSIVIDFSIPVNESTLLPALRLTGTSAPVLHVELSDDGKTATITASAKLKDLRKYTFSISNALKGSAGEAFTAYTKVFYSAPDDIKDFPEISEEALLTNVQQQTFKYFWDFAHPASGMARERNTSGNIVTSGGSGFGIMSLIVGMERNFITRAQGLERIDKILDFLETSQRFHGAWSHWINGDNGTVIPFSDNDNGADLVETSFLVEGLITFRQYMKSNVPAEQAIIDRINVLWKDVDWEWFRQEGQQVMYWHWSPTVNWTMNHQIKGWNESLITYVLAASSPTHSIPKTVYESGWASNGGMKNGNTFEGIQLPLGPDYGGPLFFTHYSFLGLNPEKLSDTYANYWTQNVNHTGINYKYCIRNPKDFVGYSEDCWGLTASDNHIGYSAHSPTNDLGVISPTAALSSFPYTPDESMKALKFFYYNIGDRLWGEYGFYDAFNITEGWTADSYLAIDQGPIIVMIENHRTGLLWDLFMSAPEVNNGLEKLGFTVTN